MVASVNLRTCGVRLALVYASCALFCQFMLSISFSSFTRKTYHGLAAKRCGATIVRAGV